MGELALKHKSFTPETGFSPLLCSALHMPIYSYVLEELDEPGIMIWSFAVGPEHWKAIGPWTVLP